MKSRRSSPTIALPGVELRVVQRRDEHVVVELADRVLGQIFIDELGNLLLVLRQQTLVKPASRPG